jgi:dipeptidyl aminopeptidase/acylaminoacyl peptidase
MTFRIGPPLTFRRLAPFAALLALTAVRGDAPPAPRAAEDAAARDRTVIEEVRQHSEALANLTYLCDETGPRLTGSKNLKRANEWAADKMKAYGLSNVHQEPWELVEGWQRGSASMRLLEPDTGVNLTVASWGWMPGTDGKVQADVVALKAATAEELAQYKGKLKGAVVMLRPPTKLIAMEDLDKPFGGVGSAAAPTDRGPQRTREEMMAFFREQAELLSNEGVAAVLTDSGKPFGLLDMTGGVGGGKDRPSAVNRTPRLFVAHHHYEMLYRLATRPAPAKARVELEVHNEFLPPVAVNNTVGEIPGTDKPDEVVVVGAHLDSWDLGEGATDNGTGSVVVLEAARALVKSGLKPRRTIRFILFTGEEQGLLGSRAYVEKHKEEIPKVSACLVHDTGTGKVVGFDCKHRPVLQPLLAEELKSLKDLGVAAFDSSFIGGSDHGSFEREGVPGLMARQEVAGYRLNHHSPIDTVDRAVEASLTQGAQAMAVAALRVADRDGLLPRDKPDPRRDPPKDDKKDDKKDAKRLTADDLARLVSVSEPRLSPDGKSVVVDVGRPNYDANRADTELVLVDVATGKRRVLTHDRPGVGQPRWSPSGDRLAFLAPAGIGKEAKRQVYVLPMDGGDALKVTDSPTGVSHFAWKPDGKEIAYAAEDEPENKKEIDKGDDAFEVGDNDFLARSAPQPVHVWLVAADGGKARRLTSGAWGLATVPPPGPPASPLAWSPDGKSIAVVRQERPHDGDNDLTTVQILDVETGKLRPLTDRKSFESCPVFSPDGTQIAYWYPRDGDPNSETEIWTAPAAGGKGACATGKLDRCVQHAVWAPDGGKGGATPPLLVGGHDGTHVALWLQPADGGAARKLDLGRVCPSWAYQMDAVVGRGGAIAFTGSEPDHPTELYYLDSPDGKPRRLTDFNAEVAGRALGKAETIAWKVGGGFEADGVVIYPPDFSAENKKKYPLVLLIHGGPQSASVERFDLFGQLIAAAGYVVFEPNYRGSDHRGNAYQHAIVGDWGKGPGEDVMAGLEALKKREFIDETRIAVTGWSYGGYMTTWLIGHYHDWKTAIAGAAVTDWRDMYDLSDGNVQMRYTLGGSPWAGDFEKQYREQSPITFVRDIKTPTLILSNTGDARVPIVQSYRLYHALKDNGVPVKFVAFPTGGHSPGDPLRQRDLFRRWVAWLDEHMR